MWTIKSIVEYKDTYSQSFPALRATQQDLHTGEPTKSSICTTQYRLPGTGRTLKLRIFSLWITGLSSPLEAEVRCASGSPSKVSLSSFYSLISSYNIRLRAFKNLCGCTATPQIKWIAVALELDLNCLSHCQQPMDWIIHLHPCSWIQVSHKAEHFFLSPSTTTCDNTSAIFIFYSILLDPLLVNIQSLKQILKTAHVPESGSKNTAK